MTAHLALPEGEDAGRATGRLAGLGPTLRIARPVRARLALTSLLGAGAILADIGLIGTAAWLVSTAAEHPNESELALAIVGVQFFGLARGFLRYGERLSGHDAALRVLAAVRVRMFERLERLAPAGLLAFRHGDLLASLVADVDSLQDLVVRVIPPFTIATVVGAVTIGFLWWMLPAAGVILGLTLFLAATAVPWITGRLARRREARFADARADLTSALVDLTEGTDELVVFGATDAQLQRIGRIDCELTAIASASAGTAGIGGALTTLLAGLASWGCLVAGIPAVVSGRLARTDLTVVTLLPLATFELVAALPTATQALSRVRQAAARVFSVIESPAPVSDPTRPVTVPGGPHDLAARALGARHPGAPTPALRDVDLSLPAGRRVAVVGPSGAGKSTLAEVLLRFLSFEAGSVSLDGVPLSQLAGEELRTTVGLVGQDAYLFDTTIAGNLRLGRRLATDQALISVLERVGLAPWVDGLPDGLATQVGRQGARLSGGQRRRIAVARALLADFPVLIVDEPTEHLDPVSADALMADLLDGTGERSLLLITHRLAGLESVDEIVVMDGGGIVEQGSHTTLVGIGGWYADLWWAQTGGDAVHADIAPRAHRRERPRAAALSGGHDTGSEMQ